MDKRKLLGSLAVVAAMAVPIVIVTQQGAYAAGAAPKAEWRPAKVVKASTAKASTARAAPKAKKAVSLATEASLQNAASPTETSPGAETAAVPDQSQDVLAMDTAMAAQILAQGPKDGYASALSDEGILYDANGASPAGPDAATARFGAFPADVKLVRTPERALAAGGSGSSWGTYTIKRGDTVLSAGRYVSVWRREVGGWKMISELAAGKTFVPPPSASTTGVLPKRPANLARPSPN